MRTFAKWIQWLLAAGAPPGADLEQRRRLRLALVVLVIALFVVVIRDIHDMRAPVPVNPEPVTAAQTRPPEAPNAAPADVNPTPASSASSRKSTRSKHVRVKRPVVNASQSVNGNGNEFSAGPAIVATDRAVLPPLQVEVVSGGQNQPLASARNSVKVNLPPGEPPAENTPATEAKAVPQSSPAGISPKVTVSRNVSERVAHSVAPTYPLLAKQMKVQGAVVLQALIDKGGRIQNLRVVSGPAILAAAAQEAVKQWRFKPYYLNGTPVETEARVSVNFTISTF
jgi:TonB family protein